MVKKSAENSLAAIAPFLTKCYDMVDDESTDEAISWSQNGNSFVIWNMTHFTVHLLPNYFKHGNFSSFMRQLNIYGFRKIDSDRWEFANDGFIRGQKHLLRSIVRRKHSSGLNQHKSSSPCDDFEDTENNLHVIWNEVESLKTDRNALTQELDKLRQHHESTKNRVLLLGERLQLMEKNQQQLLSFLVMVMQSPGFFLQLLQQKENTWRVPKTGKNMLEEVNGDGEPADGMIVRYQPLMEMDGPPSAPALEEVSDQEPSESNFWFEKAKDFFMTKPGDGQFSFMENHGSFGLPDLAEDTILKQIILGSPLWENNISSNRTNPDSEEPEGPAQVDRFLTLESLSEEMEKSEQLESKEDSRNLDLLTEQLGLLISGSANV